MKENKRLSLFESLLHVYFMFDESALDKYSGLG